MYNWLDHHLEEFIKPNLGCIPNVNLKTGDIKLWTPRLITCLEAVWKQAKKRAGSKKILLAGRDTWEFEILARVEGVLTDFRPDISTNVAINGLTNDPKTGARIYDRKGKPHPLIKEDYSEHYLLDSGYKGTIPQALGVKTWDMVSLSLGSLGLTNKSKNEQQEALDLHQVFPRAKCKVVNGAVFNISSIYNLVSPLEGSPKYWQLGVVAGDKIVQKLYLHPGYDYSGKNLSKLNSQFSRAAQITQWIVQNLRFTKPRIWMDMKVAHTFTDTNGKKFMYKVFGD